MAISLSVISASAITDLDSLNTTVADWLDRDDLALKIPTFIQLAESYFNRELRTGEMEKSVILTTASENTTLPTDYLAMRAIYIEGSPDRPLRAMAPTALRQEFDGVSDTPVAYSLVSGGLRLAPPPSATILLSLDYFASIIPLSTTSPSNWLLEQHPAAYLYATLFHAEAFLDNATRASQWKQLLDEIVGRIMRTARANRFGAGPLVPNTVTQVSGSRC